MKVIETRKVLGHCRVNFTSRIKEALDIEEGDYVIFVTDGENVIVRKIEA